MLAATPIAELCTSWHSTSGDNQPQVVALQEDNNSCVSTLTKVQSEQRWCWAPAKILTGWNSWQEKKHSHRTAVQCTLLCAWCLQPTANCSELQCRPQLFQGWRQLWTYPSKDECFLTKLLEIISWVLLTVSSIMISYDSKLFTSWLFISSLENFQVSWFNQGQACALTLWLGEQSAELFYFCSIKTFLGQPDCTYYSSWVNILPLLFWESLARSKQSYIVSRVDAIWQC